MTAFSLLKSILLSCSTPPKKPRLFICPELQLHFRRLAL